jgi:hypothetical protein
MRVALKTALLENGQHFRVEERAVGCVGENAEDQAKEWGQ